MSDEAPVTFIKKRKGAPSGLRKRPAEEAPAASTSAAVDAPPASEVIITTKRAANNHLIQGTGSSLKRRKAEDADLGLSDSDDDTLTNNNNKQESFGVRHSSTMQRPRRRSSSPPAEMSAESIKEGQRDKLAPKEEAIDDGLYRGSAGQAHKLPKAFGPVKGGPGNVRTITLVDYQPDVCKDYKGAFPCVCVSGPWRWWHQLTVVLFSARRDWLLWIR